MEKGVKKNAKIWKNVNSILISESHAYEKMMYFK